jgi:hypothetical protein
MECILALFQFLGRSSEMPSRLSAKNLHTEVMPSFCISARHSFARKLFRMLFAFDAAILSFGKLLFSLIINIAVKFNAPVVAQQES